MRVQRRVHPYEFKWLRISWLRLILPVEWTCGDVAETCGRPWPHEWEGPKACFGRDGAKRRVSATSPRGNGTAAILRFGTDCTSVRYTTAPCSHNKKRGYCDLAIRKRLDMRLLQRYPVQPQRKAKVLQSTHRSHSTTGFVSRKVYLAHQKHFAPSFVNQEGIV